MFWCGTQSDSPLKRSTFSRPKHRYGTIPGKRNFIEMIKLRTAVLETEALSIRYEKIYSLSPHSGLYSNIPSLRLSGLLKITTPSFLYPFHTHPPHPCPISNVLIIIWHTLCSIYLYFIYLPTTGMYIS